MWHRIKSIEEVPTDCDLRLGVIDAYGIREPRRCMTGHSVRNARASSGSLAILIAIRRRRPHRRIGRGRANRCNALRSGVTVSA